MLRSRRYCALFLCCLCPLAGRGQSAGATSGAPTVVQPAPASAPAAPAAPASPAADTAIPASGGGIHLDIVVTDRSGKPVSGLTASDFTLLDNNQPSRIVTFRAYDASANSADLPAQVIILFDTVNTDFAEVSYTRQQVENYLRRNDGHLAQPVSIAWLTDDGIQPQGPPTLDGNALAASLQSAEGRLRSLTRAAGAYGAVERMQLSARMLDGVLRQELNIRGRKLLIWAGPGWPMLDSPNITLSNKGQQGLFSEIVEISTLAREAHVDVYSISQGMPGNNTFLYQSFLKGVKKVSQANIPNLGLKVLAVQSGGLVLPPSNDVAGALDTCVRDAGAYYSVSFEPPPADGPDEYHKLDVRLDKPGLVARTNTGYYDEPAGR
jgi:VWFA-related protein